MAVATASACEGNWGPRSRAVEAHSTRARDERSDERKAKHKKNRVPVMAIQSMSITGVAVKAMHAADIPCEAAW